MSHRPGPGARDRIGALPTALDADGVTIVQATHDLAAARAADACLLQDSRLAGQGRPDQVLTTSSLTQIRQALRGAWLDRVVLRAAAQGNRASVHGVGGIRMASRATSSSLSAGRDRTSNSSTKSSR